MTDLIVRDLGVLEDAELSLESGSTALTGETGAGKTLLVVGLSLLAGARADKTFVRTGAQAARVEGRFVVGPRDAAGSMAIEAGFADPGEGQVELLISRKIVAEGSGSQVRINGNLATVAMLQELGKTLIDIEGQHEHLRLTEAGHQRLALDRSADLEPDAHTVAEGVRAVRELAATLETLRTQERNKAREHDSLTHEIAEIEEVAPQSGELDRLVEDARRLEHARAISEAINAADRALRGEAGAGENLAEATSALRAVIDVDRAFEGALQRLEGLSIEIDDVANDLKGLLVADDPHALEATRARISVLKRLFRKYGDDEAEVVAHLEGARKRLAELADSEHEIERLSVELTAREKVALERAKALSAARKAAAASLEEKLRNELSDLALPGAQVIIELQPRELYEGGLEDVRILVSMNPGEEPRPLAKVASGGELSRLGLALHLLTRPGVPTVVFDEVDAGVGGEAARAIGTKLAKLARESGSQVLVVTHLPQVAACADRHYRVVKVVSKGTAVAVEAVRDEARVLELSRMMTGLPESESAQDHARELLELSEEVAT